MVFVFGVFCESGFGLLASVAEGGVDVVDTQNLFDVINTIFSQHNSFALFVYVIITRLELAHSTCELFVGITRRNTWCANNKRRTSFVNKDGVGLINDSEIQLSLSQLVNFAYHIVT